MDQCECCANNKNGVVNIGACKECICPVSDSAAFKHLLAENEKLREQIRIVDEDWKHQVTQKALELIALLKGEPK